ncbi:LacI family DNA-binding transcriptional regulator [Deinococcus roseus]|uniref:LacI family transcriptional regulator n=1 Tax=Deinococcus roseus TaxID=392414 RepID=A0ABQ2D136_9DEIO|nr:LacI family DNA-binding transcriptional regulator [Deinococcus roseus]GGJ36118.1 LacI family transcriptional regulator [Deinococcus roseus]
MTNIKAVAKRAGVSPSTAKRAINEPEKLSPALLHRVLQAIKELDYEPDLTARALRQGHTLNVGFLVPDLVEPFSAQLAQEVSVRLQHTPHILLLANSSHQPDLERHNLKRFSGQRISALIIRPSYGSGNLDYLLKMKDKGTYIIEVDHHLPDSPFDHVMLDHEQAIRLGLDHLTALGHTRIACLSTPSREGLLAGRTLMFEREMAARGIPVPPLYREINRHSTEDAYRFTRHLLGLPDPPTALFVLGGLELLGVHQGIQDAGLSVPGDISLLAFDEDAWTSRMKPGIDGIEQPVGMIGETLVRQVLKNTPAPVEPLQLKLPGRLIQRGSCAPPRGR